MSEITGVLLLCQVCILTLSNHSLFKASLFPIVKLPRKTGISFTFGTFVESQDLGPVFFTV